MSRTGLELVFGHSAGQGRGRRGKLADVNATPMDFDEDENDLEMTNGEASTARLSDSNEFALDPLLESESPETLEADSLDSLREGLSNLDLEWQLEELLQQNARAVQRLSHLQEQRYLTYGGDADGAVKEDSEEYKLGRYSAMVY